MPQRPIIVKNGRLIDPVQGFDGPADLLLADGRVAAVAGPGAIPAEDRLVFDAQGLWVLPGLIDMHVHLRDPGHEHKEDLVSGLAAAAAGGFCAVLAMPNTSPPVDQADLVKSLVARGAQAGGARLMQSAALTKGRLGQELTEYDALKRAGAAALTDDGSWVADAAVMRRALDYAHVCDLLPLSHAQEPTLAPGGLIHEGRVSTRLGLPGQPAQVEEMAIFRDLALVRLTGKPLHICHVSTASGLALIRAAKAEGLPVSCETAPHYLFLTDEDVGEYDANFKINPPLRAAADREALRQGLADGTIDVVATDHAPHSSLEKEVEFSDAAFGAIGLETALPLTLELLRALALPPSRLAEALSAQPAKLLKLPGGTLRPGAPADVTLVDPQEAFVYRVAESLSKSRNSPFDGRRFQGRAAAVIVDGEIRWRRPTL
ncbi:MAG: dihydroorotase [Deltaproteobacteria bacterium]|jgi:dihydroorotase|nr:dihydroorotase [Deltaproteobacteria bacterium]